MAGRGRLKLKGPRVVTPPVANTIRSTERIFFDLTTDLAVFDDAYTVSVSVSSSSGVFTANCWNDNTISNGETTTQVLRDLQDHFYVETIGAADGSVAGTLMVTGTLLAGGTETLSYEFTVEDYPTTIDTTMGALTLPKFGGLLINNKLPGTASGWSIKTDASGLYTIHNVGSEYWLVLSGTLYTGGFGVSVPSAPLAAMAGQTKTVVLQHNAGEADRTINFEVIANQFDVAPRSTDTNTATTGNQAVIFWGRYNPKAAPATGDLVCMCEAGTYSTGASTVLNSTGNTASFPTTNQPTQPYIDGWAYSEYLKPSAGWITMKSRTPLGAVFERGIALNVQLVTRNANGCMGFRLSNLKTTDTGSTVAISNGKITVSDLGSANNPFNTVMIDHCDCYGIDFGRPTAVQGRIFGVQNRYRGTTFLKGYDCQDCGSLWYNNRLYALGCDQYSVVTASQSNGSGGAGKVLNVTDISSQTTPLRVGSAIYLTGAAAAGNLITALGTGTGGLGTYTVNGADQLVASGVAKTFPSDLENAAADSMSIAIKNSTPGSGRSRIAFPTFIGGKAITLNHLDVVQYDGLSFSGAETVDSILGYGWMIVPGQPYVITANDLQGVADAATIGLEAAQGQSQFAQNVPSTSTLTLKYVGNVIANNIGVGSLITYPSSSVVIKNNMYLYPISITASLTGGSSPAIKFQVFTGAASGAGITVKDNLSTQSDITYNTTFTPTVTDNGNVWGISSADQTANLTSPSIGAAATSRSKAIQAYTPKAGAASDYLTKGPFFNKAMIDQWRQTADETYIQDAS